MRILILAAALISTGAFAQTVAPTAPSAPPAAAAVADAQSAPKSDWVRVEALKMGTSIHIKTNDHGSTRCIVGAVDAESITCGGVKFKRASILYIKNSHRVRSSLVGLGAGAGLALAITVGLAEHCKDLNCSVGSAITLAIIDLAAFVATPIVFGVYDLTAGTIYKAATP
jgi:hypothetical protein